MMWLIAFILLISIAGAIVQGLTKLPNPWGGFAVLLFLFGGLGLAAVFLH